MWREDDAEVLIAAIKQIRGVLSVEGVVSDLATHTAEIRVKNELWQKLRDTFWDDKK